MVVLSVLDHLGWELKTADDLPELDSEFIRRPTVKVDAVAVLLELGGVLVELIRGNAAADKVDERRPFMVVVCARRLWAGLVVDQEMLKRRAGARSIDAVTPVRKREQNNSTPADDAHVILQSTDRVLAMLQKVTCNHEIHALVAEGG